MDKVISGIRSDLGGLDFHGKVDYLNKLRYEIHKLSPFKNEPVDYVRWELCDNVVANDYNPNKVAPPEMELLEVSIINDGYTQPIVTWPNEDKGKIEVIDGFHRNRVGRESKIVRNRINGYLPVVNIRNEQSSKSDRIASTIRHNRARGKHQVNAMSEIVIELKNRNWTNARISKQLGMDEEEVLRLCQISGLEHLFTDEDFSSAWKAEDDTSEYKPVTDKLSDEVLSAHRIPNEKDDTRIFHTFDKWECHKAGFYATGVEGKSHEECKAEYVRIYTDPPLLESILEKVIAEWVHSCEHYLTNKSMNRVAWLGQAAVCYETGVPQKYCSVWSDLTDEQRHTANITVLKYVNKWLEGNGMEALSLEQGINVSKQVELY